jgi:hypothetical protein
MGLQTTKVLVCDALPEITKIVPKEIKTAGQLKKFIAQEGWFTLTTANAELLYSPEGAQKALAGVQFPEPSAPSELAEFSDDEDPTDDLDELE